MNVGAIRVLQIGLGPIGCESVRVLLERPNLRLVGAVDAAPDKVARDVGEILGSADPLGISVSGSIDAAFESTEANVALLATSSSLAVASEQIEACVARGLHVVSSCEELAYPWGTQPALAERIDRAAERAGVAVLGTGVNPGFLMDFLPAAMTGVCRNVRHVLVERIQDATQRRLPFQKKVGAGLSPDAFAARVEEGTLRHVGLAESMHLIAAALGWRLDAVTDDIRPIVAEHAVPWGEGSIEPGHARGVFQLGTAMRRGEEVIRLVFRAAIGEPESVDRITLDGVPPLMVEIPGGVNGDVATCAILVNAIPTIVRAQPGLRTMLDVGVVSGERAGA